jgi:hypothetical protein
MNNAEGIFNPFKEREEPKPNITQLQQMAEPEQAPEKFSARLDGDSFGISFEKIEEDEDSEDLAERLAQLLYDVNSQFRAELRECGIKILRPTIAYVAEPGEMVLRSKSAVIVVSTGLDQNESAVFRRIGHSLHMLPIKTILEKHNAKLHVRG